MRLLSHNIVAWLLALFVAHAAFAQTEDQGEVDVPPEPRDPAEPAPIAPPPGPPPTINDNPTEIVTEISVRGNAKVESDAIITLLKLTKGDPLKRSVIQEDMRTLFELGYFSDIRVFRKPSAGGVHLVFEVKEKPAITSIAYEGLEEVTEEDVIEKMETRLYTIVNEATITADARMIEKLYAEKGFYLATVTYTLEDKGNETALTFFVEERGMVQVGNVDILGNEFYTDADIINGTPGLVSRPYTRSTAFSSASIYQEEFVKRDNEYISYIYRDQGFSEVKVAKPFQLLDSDREFVQVTFQVEEGLQYDVGSIDVQGDLLFPKEELISDMLLKPGELFRYSRFTKDIEVLGNKYGDLGYAYADVNPKVKHDREKKIVHITYEITKGEKVYFGKMTITGNTKTRDNVIRRELEVADSQLYSGTGLDNTKRNINRLGFFEEVQIIKKRDENDRTLQNLNIKVKEKPTGQLQAAIGFTPSSGREQGSQWFGQGRYDEKNQSGKGWRTNLSGKWNGEENYEVRTGFSDPRVNDSYWEAGVNVGYQNSEVRYLDDVSVIEKKTTGSIFLGRKIIEQIRGRVTYSISQVERDSGDVFLLPRFREEGIFSSMIFSLLRTDVDNFIDPTDGSDIALRQKFTGGPILRGDHQFMESEADVEYYYPLDFTDTYRTYFKFHLNLAYIYPMGGEPVPFTERYRLGGYNDLRGYDYWEIGPRFSLLRAPGGFRSSVNKGGDKRFYTQLEYFMPLIPEAGIKALVFGDMGRVYDDNEKLEWADFAKDVGFGFRWITPIAPFRFEWAYPIEDGQLGELEIIFYIGY